MPDSPLPSLRFLGWHEPAVDLVAKRLLELEENDADVFRRATVVTLTAPAARYLHERVAELAGRPILMPRFVLPGNLLPKPPSSEHEQLFAWVKTLQALPVNACPNLLGERVEAMSSIRALGTARQLLHLRTLLEQEATTPEAVRDALPQISDDKIPNWSALLEEEAERWNDFCSLCTAVDQLAPPVTSLPLQPRPRSESMLILAALPELSSRLRKALEEILEERPGHVEVWVNAPEEERLNFDSWGIPVADHWLKRPIDIPEDSILSPADDAQSFAEAAVREAGDGDADEVTLGLCDPSFSSALCTTFAHAKPIAWELQLSAGRKLTTMDAAQLPARLLHYINAVKNLRLSGESGDILRAADSEYVSAFVELLRSPSLQRNEPTALSMDEVLDKILSENRPGSLRQLMDLLDRENPDCKKAAEVNRSLADQFLSSNTFPDALLTLADMLERAYPDSDDIALLTESVRSVANICAKQRTEPELALLLLQQSVENATCTPSKPEEGEQPPVKTFDWIDLPCTRGKKLLLLGLHEGCVPEMSGNVNFLTDKLKECLGLPTRSSREARDAFLLTALLKSRHDAAQNVRILLARQGRDDTPIAPSPLLLRCRDDAELAARVERLFSDGGAAKPEQAYEEFSFHPASHASSFVLGQHESIELLAPGVPNPFAADANKPRNFSPSLIRNFLACPLRFWLKILYRLDPGEAFTDSEREIGNDVYGSILHDILRRLAEHFPSRPSDVSLPQLEENIFHHALHLLQEGFRDYYTDANRTLPVFLQNQYETMLESLRQFALLHAHDLEDGWCVQKVEWDVTPTLDLPDGSRAPLHMKIDRVDFRPSTKKWRIIDYKTGNDTPDKKHLAKAEDPVRYGMLLPELPLVDGKRWTEVQLPLYAYALRQEEGEMLPPELAYYNLPRGKRVSYNAFPACTEDVIRSGLDCARQVILLLRQGKCLVSIEDLGGVSPEYSSFGTPSIDKKLRAFCGLPDIPSVLFSS